MKAKAKIGQFFFGRNYNTWGIWQYETINQETGGYTAQKVCNCYTYEEAVKTMYQMNGWGEPKYITRKY